MEERHKKIAFVVETLVGLTGSSGSVHISASIKNKLNISGKLSIEEAENLANASISWFYEDSPVVFDENALWDGFKVKGKWMDLPSRGTSRTSSVDTIVAMLPWPPPDFDY